MLKWLRYLWFCEDGFFGIGQGPSSQQQQQYGNISSLANFATSEGEGDIGSSDKFWKAILSGDSSKISQVLGPAISGINKRGQESKMTMAQFGNRGGGTNAGLQMTDDTTRSSVDSMVSSLTGTSATALGSSGQSLLSTGESADATAFSEATTIQQEHAAKMNDIFNSIMKAAETVAIIA